MVSILRGRISNREIAIPDQPFFGSADASDPAPKLITILFPEKIMNSLSKHALSAPETTLAGVVNDQPWNQYLAGQGINALTGQLTVSAVLPLKIDNFPNLNVEQRYQSISTEEEFQSLFSAEAEGSYNMESIKVSGSASFLSKVNYSNSSMTIVATYEIVSNGYGNPTDPPQLSPDAQSYLDQYPEKFRDKYGDYFVSNWTAGARMIATYTCKASSAESLAEFNTAISAETDILSAKGSASFSQKAASKNISIDCYIKMEGASQVPPHFDLTPEGLVEALNWFSATDSDGKPLHLAYVPRRAMFTHYSQLSSEISNTLQIDPSIFGDIQALRFRITRANTLLSNLPDYYARQPGPGGESCEAILTRLTKTFEASQATLASDPTLIKTLTDDCKALIAQLEPAADVVSFYDSLTKTNHGDSGGDSKHSHTYGITEKTKGLPVPIEVASDSVAEEWHIGFREHRFSWPWSPYDESQVVTGWRILANWGDGSDGDWSDGSLIGKNSGSVNVKSEYDRGYNWTLQVCFVRKNHFPWL
jgi:hypothetical protein